MLAALRALDRALAEKRVTKAGLRPAMLAALAAIAERGPEAVPWPFGRRRSDAHFNLCYRGCQSNRKPNG